MEPIVRCEDCDECFLTAISAEITARMYYQRLSALFSQEPVIAEFLGRMADDEAEHVRMLQTIRDEGAHDPRLHREARAFTRALLHLVTRAGDHLTRTPANFQEAFDFMCRLEGDEINEIYLRLTQPDGEAATDVKAQVNQHVHRLRELGERYTQARREQILPRVR